MTATYFSYWGKAVPTYGGQPQWHPLIYHCLDVAAVAAAWWDASPALRGRFAAAFPGEPDPMRLRAWLLFFVALHDLGKCDLRFQLKALETLLAILGEDAPQTWREMQCGHGISQREIKEFDHGRAGLVWAKLEIADWCGNADKEARWDVWLPWLTAATGHHGDYPDAQANGLDKIEADDLLITHDRQARHALVVAFAEVFLAPVGSSVRDLPPWCSPPARALLAGFCACCDWMGSDEKRDFPYRHFDASQSLSNYHAERVANLQQNCLIERNGLSAPTKSYAGAKALLGQNESPRGVQTLIDALPVTPGLTLIEAPTGSGKTEAALAYAWRLLDAGVADSIVFALPTQATANAMLARAEAFAELAYGRANVVLAHGKSRLNEGFQRLAESGHRSSLQGAMEAGAQCAAWLANSRKVVFLGQIGVCTVDQVLLSVLPVRHKFMRGFGLAKSVLIVDEVHAYDAYMHGLLGEVLRAQKGAGGSAVLLSATLPTTLRGRLLESWGANGQANASYPAVWHTSGGEVKPRIVDDSQRPAQRVVETECVKLPGAFPDAALIARIVAAAQAGAQVAVVMNLVDDAQHLARALRSQVDRERLEIDIDLFHARFRFADRQKKERACVERYGRNGTRERGRVLVATQVVEQSLDLDFDWMLTQICPVDLLFQRLGRLHRHARNSRPPGFESPRCTVMSMPGDHYQLHEAIYGNARVLWRTEELLRRGTGAVDIVFPDAYRDWIEVVYSEVAWDNEPERIHGNHMAWASDQRRREVNAKQLANMSVAQFRDEEGTTLNSLTRDGEMSLNVLPIQRDGRLLDGQRLADLPERDQAEALNLNAVPAPASWKDLLRECVTDSDGASAGYHQLVLTESETSTWYSAKRDFSYSAEFGLQKHSGGKTRPSESPAPAGNSPA